MGKGREVRVNKNRNNRNRSPFDDPFIDGGERVSEKGVLRISEVEIRPYQLVQQGLGEILVDGEIVFAAREGGARTLSGHNRKGGYRGEEKGFQMIAAEDDHGIRFGFVEFAAQFPHGGDIGIELRQIFAGRPGEKLRGMAGSHSRYYLSHASRPT